METILGIIATGVVTFVIGYRLNRSQAQNYDADTISRQSKQVNELVAQVATLRADVDRLSEQVEGKDELLAQKNKTIEGLSAEFQEFQAEVRKYFSELLKYFEEKGLTDYPKPSDKLLDTNPHMKAVRNK